MSPGFSMRGSGVDTITRTRTLECADCTMESEVDFDSEDSAGDFEWQCKHCGNDHTTDFDDSDGIDPDVNFND